MRAFEGLTGWMPAVLLGLATIGAYGTAYYAISVLLPVIQAESGWRLSTLSAGVSAGLVGQGVVAMVAGRVFDRRGSSVVLLSGLTLGAALLAAATLAAQAWQFAAVWAMGSSLIGGCLFYSLTMPLTARLYPGRRAAAFSVLTLLGALAAPLFYPLAGFLLERMDWQATLRVLVGVMLVCCLPAGVFVKVGARATAGEDGSPRLMAAIWEPRVRRWLLVIAFASLANSALLLTQVLTMQAAGLALGTAAAFAGARGLFQIPGRLLLTPLMSRFGIRGAITLAYVGALSAVLALLLAVQGHASYIAVAYFCAVGGMSLGLLSPLNGLFQAETFGESRLGVLSGVAVSVSSAASATGALVSGLLLDLSDSFALLLACIVLIQCLALGAFRWQGKVAI